MCRLVLLLYAGSVLVYACISSELDFDCDSIRQGVLVNWSSIVFVGE